MAQTNPTPTPHAKPVLQQASLLDWTPPAVKPPHREPYGGALPAVRGSDTSEAAAASMEGHAPIVRARILATYEELGRYGATCDQIEAILGLSHQTASARIRGLVLEGLLADSKERGHTRSGRKARIYVRTALADPRAGATTTGGNQ